MHPMGALICMMYDICYYHTMFGAFQSHDPYVLCENSYGVSWPSIWKPLQEKLYDVSLTGSL